MKRIIAVFILVIYLCQVTIALALPSNTPTYPITSAYTIDGINNDSTLPTNEGSSDPLAALQSIGLGSPHWDWGPLSVGGEYDTLLGMIFNAQYSKKMGQDWAVGLLGEYGPNQYRLNGTLGHQLWQDGQVKFTTDYLSQVLPFEFDSGNINQEVNQTAFGLQFQQNFHQHWTKLLRIE